MDRSFVYPSSIPQDTDILTSNKQPMVALGRLCAALFGTGGLVYGLPVSPTSPPSLSVNVGAGEIYQLENIDNTAYGSLAADTTDQIIKQGILLQASAPVVLACPAPTTAGFSINYLIEATYADADINDTVLPYYNAANPTQPYAGPGNNGQAQATTRAGQVSLQAKAGIAATTGSQATPTLDAGFIALAIVTVANGQSSIVAGNISAVTASVLPSSLLQMIQNGLSSYALDSGAANAYAVAYTPAITAVVDGLQLRFKAQNANTGASTFAPNGVAASPIIGGAYAALQGGEIVANGDIEVVWNSTLASWVLLEQAGGPVQVAAAAQSSQAVNLGQLSEVSHGRLLNIRVFTSSTTYTPTAGTNSIIVEALGGGGGGGGCSSTSSAACSGGGSGNGASYAKGFFTSSFSGLPVTIGSGGAASSGNAAGGTGGTSSLGTLLVAPGGTGGLAGGSALTAAPGVLAALPSANAAPTGGNIINVPGQQGTISVALALGSGQQIGSSGGGSIYGNGGLPHTLTSNGSNGLGYGAGASGGLCGPGQSTPASGGTGASGIIIIMEFA